MYKTRSVSQSTSIPRSEDSKVGSSYRPLLHVGIVLDPNGDQLLLDIIRECEFAPAVPLQCVNPQNEVQQAVDDIIAREGDFSVLTCQMIQHQLRLKFSDEIMMQHASRLGEYIRDSLSATIWSPCEGLTH